MKTVRRHVLGGESTAYRANEDVGVLVCVGPDGYPVETPERARHARGSSRPVSSARVDKTTCGEQRAFVHAGSTPCGAARVSHNCPDVSYVIGIQRFLRQYGPLWTHGQAHIFVIAGVDVARDRVFVHDPWPVNSGRKEWRPYQSFISGGQASSPGTSGIEASFLYHP